MFRESLAAVKTGAHIGLDAAEDFCRWKGSDFHFFLLLFANIISPYAGGRQSPSNSGGIEERGARKYRNILLTKIPSVGRILGGSRPLWLRLTHFIGICNKLRRPLVTVY